MEEELLRKIKIRKKKGGKRGIREKGKIGKTG
jgi:hypothetical protein